MTHLQGPQAAVGAGGGGEAWGWGAGALARPGFLIPVTRSRFPVSVQGLAWSLLPVRQSQGCGVGPLFPTPPGLAQGRKQERHVASDLNAERQGLCPVSGGVGFHTLLSWGPHQAGTSLGASPAQDMPRVAGMCGSMCKCVCERERETVPSSELPGRKESPVYSTRSDIDSLKLQASMSCACVCALVCESQSAHIACPFLLHA